MAGSSDVGYTDSESKEASLSDTLSDKEIEGIIHKFQKVSIIDKDLAKLIIDSGINKRRTSGDRNRQTVPDRRPGQRKG